MKKYFAYYRVSTSEQTTVQQHQEVIQYANEHGVYVGGIDEHASGKSMENRPKLQEAIRKCKRDGLTLLVLKLDRLAREEVDAYEVFKQVDVESVHEDTHDELLRGIFIALAKKERMLIRQRTKAKLDALKAEGVKLGNPKLRKDADGNLSEEAKKQLEKNRESMIKARRQGADNNQANKLAWAVIQGREGSLQELACMLNDAGCLTPTGKPWGKMQVLRLRKRYTTA